MSSDPQSLTPRLPAVEAESLPEEIVKAIDGLQFAYEAIGQDAYLSEARADLDATILRHLSAAEAERDEVRDQLGNALRRWVDTEIRIFAALARAERAEKALEDPVALHVNMLRGTIAKPSIENIIHLYGAEALRTALSPAAEGA